MVFRLQRVNRAKVESPMRMTNKQIGSNNAARRSPLFCILSSMVYRHIFSHCSKSLQPRTFYIACVKFPFPIFVSNFTSFLFDWTSISQLSRIPSLKKYFTNPTTSLILILPPPRRDFVH